MHYHGFSCLLLGDLSWADLGETFLLWGLWQLGQTYSSASYRDNLPQRGIWWWSREDKLVLGELLQVAVNAVSQFLSSVVTNVHVLSSNCTSVLSHCCLNKMSVCLGHSGYIRVWTACVSLWKFKGRVKSFRAVGFHPSFLLAVSPELWLFPESSLSQAAAPGPLSLFPLFGQGRLARCHDSDGWCSFHHISN